MTAGCKKGDREVSLLNGLRITGAWNIFSNGGPQAHDCHFGGP